MKLQKVKSEFKERILISIKERFIDAEKSKCALLSTLLDPRFKKSKHECIIYK
jgi:hypothetical protein